MKNEKGIALIFILFLEILFIILFGIGIIYLLKYNNIIFTKGNDNIDKLDNEEYNLNLSFEVENIENESVTELYDELRYKIFDYGVTSYVNIGEKKYEVKEALENNIISVADIMEKVQYDEKEEKCKSDYYLDGGSAEYYYNDYTILVTEEEMVSTQSIVFMKKGLYLNDFSEVYENDSTLEMYSYDEDYGIGYLKESSKYDRAEPSDNITYSYEMGEKYFISKIAQDNLYTLEVFDGNVKININNSEYNIKDALNNKLITIKNIIDKCDKDVKDSVCDVNYSLEDGEYRIYYYENFNILVQNKLYVENPTITFLMNYTDNSNYLNDYLQIKKSTYDGPNFEKGIAVKARLNKILSDSLWIIEVDHDNLKAEENFNFDVAEYNNYDGKSDYLYALELNDEANIDSNINEGDLIYVNYTKYKDETLDILDYRENARDNARGTLEISKVDSASGYNSWEVFKINEVLSDGIYMVTYAKDSFGDFLFITYPTDVWNICVSKKETEEDSSWNSKTAKEGDIFAIRNRQLASNLDIEIITDTISVKKIK